MPHDAMLRSGGKAKWAGQSSTVAPVTDKRLGVSSICNFFEIKVAIFAPVCYDIERIL